MSEIIITQTVSPKQYCKYEHTMCEFANDRGYCVKTGCTKRIIINEVQKVNNNLVEIVRCKDCIHYCEADRAHPGTDWCKRLICGTVQPDFFCADGERKDGKEEE